MVRAIVLNVVRSLLIVAATLAPALCFAQEAKRFNAKELEKQFDPIPVFSVNGQAVDNEVVVSADLATGNASADYLVAAEAKKVIEFYQVKLATKPRKTGDLELGTLKFVFAPKPFKEDAYVIQVVVRPVEDNPRITAIRLLKRPATEHDERD
ncbi:MAG: hypothetical protein QM765_25250 [Myxococcales bacterium]